MRTADLALAALLFTACNGTFDGSPPAASSDDASSSGSSSGSSPGSSSASSGGPSDGGERGPDAEPGDGAVGSTDAPAVFADASAPCQTSVDGYGFTRCVCAPNVAALGDAAVSACSGYDCCVAYGADSGLAAGFGDPSLSSGLCACFHADDIAAVLGATATCGDFARDGVGNVVKGCP
jgi:hypothetical protein